MPSVNIIELDVNSQFEQMLAHGANFGFTDTTDSCIGNTGYPPMPPSTTAAACVGKPSAFLFWDSIHPMTAGHRFIASEAFSALYAAAVSQNLAISSVLNAAGSGSALSPGAPFMILGADLGSALLPAGFPLTNPTRGHIGRSEWDPGASLLRCARTNQSSNALGGVAGRGRSGCRQIESCHRKLLIFQRGDAAADAIEHTRSLQVALRV